MSEPAVAQAPAEAIRRYRCKRCGIWLTALLNTDRVAYCKGCKTLYRLMEGSL